MGQNSQAELSMRGGYLATESLRVTSCCAGLLNNRGITAKEYVEHSGLKSQSANISWGMRCDECLPRLCRRRLDRSEFRPMAEVSSPVLSMANAKRK